MYGRVGCGWEVCMRSGLGSYFVLWCDCSESVYMPGDPLPESVRNRPSSEELSELEVYGFLRDRPNRYFAYYSDETICTWTGQKLGDIVYKGPLYTIGFWPGAKMQRIRVRAITGDMYAGNCAVSGGNYCHLKKMRSK